MNPMQQIRIEKITLNVGAGKEQKQLEKGVKLLQLITGREPMKTTAKKRIPSWGLRPGLPIGCKLTLRGEEAEKLLKRLLEAKDNKIKTTQFDESGSVSFGIHEYIDIPGVEYNPEIGIMGFEVCVTLERPGFRIKRRKYQRKKIKKHAITKDEAVKFMKQNFKIITEVEE